VEGVVVEEPGPWPDMGEPRQKSDPDGTGGTHLHPRLEARLLGKLEAVEESRAKARRALDAAIWREKLIKLAADRATRVTECGWDQRLCFGEYEWAEFGEGVLESYEALEERLANGDNGEEMEVDRPDGSGEWWCNGKQKCDRHAG
jgi:COMPASS component SPP1